MCVALFLLHLWTWLSSAQLSSAWLGLDCSGHRSTCTAIGGLPDFLPIIIPLTLLPFTGAADKSPIKALAFIIAPANMRDDCTRPTGSTLSHPDGPISTCRSLYETLIGDHRLHSSHLSKLPARNQMVAWPVPPSLRQTTAPQNKCVYETLYML